MKHCLENFATDLSLSNHMLGFEGRKCLRKIPENIGQHISHSY